MRNGLIAVGNCNIRRPARTRHLLATSAAVQQAASNGGTLMANPQLIWIAPATLSNIACVLRTAAWEWPHAIDAFGEV